MDIRNLIPFGKKNIDIRREEENPFSVMQREVNRLFDSFSRNWSLAAFPEFGTAFTPRLEVTENVSSFVVKAELPGMTEKDIDLSLAGDTLTIRGEKKEEREDKNVNFYFAERSYGSFSRTIPLPREVDEGKVSASFKKGILTITLPKTDSAREPTKKIPVRTE